jgi:hypothetical protein
VLVTSYPPFLTGSRSIDTLKFVRGFGQAVLTLSGLQDPLVEFVVDVLNFIRLLCHNEFSPELLNFLRTEEKRLRSQCQEFLPVSDHNMNWHFLLHHLVSQIFEWGSLCRVWLYPAERINLFMRGLLHSRVHAEENALNTIHALVTIVNSIPSEVVLIILIFIEYKF